MRLPALAAFALSCLTLAIAACGGGGEPKTAAPDLANVPTATMPAELPTPFSVGGGAAVLPGGGNSYAIRSGDTLADVAERFGISLEDLLAANPDINPATLHVGDVIALPQGTDPAAPEPTEEPAAEDTPTPEAEPTEPLPTNTPSSLGQTYTVQSGDIPVTIAEKFGITVEELLAANPGIDATNLQIGQVLVIPAAAAPAEGG